MKPGDTIEIRALHADRQAYRWWPARVESMNGPEIVVTWPAGTVFAASTWAGEKISKLQYREYFWLDRPYNIAAGYTPEGEFDRIYADLTSLPWIEDGRLFYIDHELDVIRHDGEPAFIDDEDEFEEAAVTYGYTPSFQESYRQITEDVRRIVDGWQPAKTFNASPVSPLTALEGLQAREI